MTEATFADRYAQAQEMLRQAVAETRARIESGPDNPAIKRFPGSKIAFTMSQSELGRVGNWTPFTHDWPAQYEKASQMLEAGRYSDLRSVLQTGRCREGGSPLQFADEVVTRLRSILGDLPDHAPRNPAGAAGGRARKP